MDSRYVTMVTENGDIGIFKISLLEMNAQSVVDFNTKNCMSNRIIFQKLQ